MGAGRYFFLTVQLNIIHSDSSFNLKKKYFLIICSLLIYKIITGIAMISFRQESLMHPSRTFLAAGGTLATENMVITIERNSTLYATEL